MSVCPFCQKPQAFSLPSGGWYTPPIYPALTYTAGTTTNITFSLSANTQPIDYCYGHTFVLCEECLSPVPYGYHTPEACAVLRGFRQGIAELRASMEQAMPLRECLPERYDVPDVFQEAFSERERL